VSIKQQVCVEPSPSALNVTLPAFAAERRRLHHGARSAPAAIDRYLLPQGAQQQTRRQP